MLGELRLGADDGFSDRFGDVVHYEVRYFERVLPEAELRKAFEAGQARFAKNVPTAIQRSLSLNSALGCVTGLRALGKAGCSVADHLMRDTGGLPLINVVAPLVEGKPLEEWMRRLIARSDASLQPDTTLVAQCALLLADLAEQKPAGIDTLCEKVPWLKALQTEGRLVEELKLRAAAAASAAPASASASAAALAGEPEPEEMEDGAGGEPEPEADDAPWAMPAFEIRHDSDAERGQWKKIAMAGGKDGSEDDEDEAASAIFRVNRKAIKLECSKLPRGAVHSELVLNFERLCSCYALRAVLNVLSHAPTSVDALLDGKGAHVRAVDDFMGLAEKAALLSFGKDNVQQLLMNFVRSAAKSKNAAAAVRCLFRRELDTLYRASVGDSAVEDTAAASFSVGDRVTGLYNNGPSPA